MRIRNSRCPFHLPCLPAQTVSRSSHFRSKGIHFDERFLVEESSRRIGWSSHLLRRPLKKDIEDAQMQDQLQLAIAGETKSLNHVAQRSGKENCISESPIHASQTHENSGNEERKSNFSREANSSKFSVVLALPARGTFSRRVVKPTPSRRVVQPTPSLRGFSRPDSELPLKKRRLLCPWGIESTDARNEVKMKTTMAGESQMSKGMNCVLNCESSVPSPNKDNPPGQGKFEQMVPTTTAIVSEEKPKRKRGRPRKEFTYQQ